MTFTPAQVTISTVATTLCVMPPGPCELTISNVSTVNTVYIGTGASAGTVTATNGYPVTNVTSPVTFTGFNGSAGATIYAIASGTATTVGYVISAASGGTGL